MKKKPTKKKAELGLVWVARDKEEFGSGGPYYVVSMDRPEFIGGGWLHSLGDINVCPAPFHRIFPTIRLKPGEGPIRVRLTAEVVDGGAK